MKLEIEKLRAVPDAVPDEFMEEEEYYRELTRRNEAFITPEAQKALAGLRVLVAGCGSTGGACIESLARVGVRHFALADSGSYELTNLNRQHASIEDLGKNKAAYHAEQLRKINPFAEILDETCGITPFNAEKLVAWADLVIDAVDVTTPSAIKMKLLLHQVSKLHRRPVFTALDMGFCQWGQSYDYRKASVKAVSELFPKGVPQHPLKTLFTMVPLSAVPTHCLRLVRDMLRDPGISASQLGCTSDLLSAIIVPSVIRFVETGTLVKGWDVDLNPLAKSWRKRFLEALERPKLIFQVSSLLRKAP